MLTLINGVSRHTPMFGVTNSDIAPNSMIDTEGWRQQTFAIRNAKEEYNDCNFSMTGSHYIKIRGNKVSANNTVEIMNIFDVIRIAHFRMPLHLMIFFIIFDRCLKGTIVMGMILM